MVHDLGDALTGVEQQEEHKSRVEEQKVVSSCNYQRVQMDDRSSSDLEVMWAVKSECLGREYGVAHSQETGSWEEIQ